LGQEDAGKQLPPIWSRLQDVLLKSWMPTASRECPILLLDNNIWLGIRLPKFGLRVKKAGYSNIF
jgi:hypothetical protein